MILPRAFEKGKNVDNSKHQKTGYKIRSFEYSRSKKIDGLCVHVGYCTWIAASVEPCQKETKFLIFEVHLENPAAFVAFDPSKSCFAFVAAGTTFAVAFVVAFADFAESFVAAVVFEEVSVGFSQLQLH